MPQYLTFRAILGPEGLEHDRFLEIDDHGVISHIGERDGPYDGFLAVPAMPNAHSHVFQRALAGVGEEARGEDSFWSWREAMYRLAETMTPDQLYAVARQAFVEMLRGGFTDLLEFHYLHHLPGGDPGPDMAGAIVRAGASVGLRVRLLPVYYRTSGFDGAPATEGQKRFVHDSVDDFLRLYEGLGDQAGGVAPHSLRAVPPGDLSELVAGVESLILPAARFHIHVSEQEREVEECTEAFGASPIDLLADTVDLDERWHLVHATHATPSERKRVRAAGAGVVLCPLTEAYLGDGIFEAREHFTEGGTASIGTDANTRISAIEELRMLEYGQRLRDRRRARLGTEAGVGGALWNWAASGGNAAGAFVSGRIEVGMKADLVVLDPEGPSLLGHEADTALDAWLVGGDARDIEAVYRGGRRMVERGVVAKQGEIRDAFVGAMKEIWG